MVKQLTKKAKIDAEKMRISQLTNKHDAYFKLIISHQIDEKYNFCSIFSRNGNGVTTIYEKTLVIKALGKFTDESVKLTITEVEDRYGRVTDKSEGTYDPASGDNAQIEHYCLFKKSDKSNLTTDGFRLHGYMRTNGGYFVVTKFDWFHEVNKK